MPPAAIAYTAWKKRILAGSRFYERSTLGHHHCPFPPFQPKWTEILRRQKSYFEIGIRKLFGCEKGILIQINYSTFYRGVR